METKAENSAKGMMTALGIVSLYIMHVTKIHCKNDFHAEWSPFLLKILFIYF